MNNNKKHIAILGSTGSIGTQALEVISEHSDFFEVVVLTANSNSDLLIQQANSTSSLDSKDSLLREAKTKQEQSQVLLDEAEQSLQVASRYDAALDEKRAEAEKLSGFNEELLNAKENGSDLTALTEQINESEDREIKSPIQSLQEDAKKKEKEANGFLSEAEALRADQESMIYQIDKDKEALKFTKKKKDKVKIEENIETVREKSKKSTGNGGLCNLPSAPGRRARPRKTAWYWHGKSYRAFCLTIARFCRDTI